MTGTQPGRAKQATIIIRQSYDPSHSHGLARIRVTVPPVPSYGPGPLAGHWHGPVNAKFTGTSDCVRPYGLRGRVSVGHPRRGRSESQLLHGPAIVPTRMMITVARSRVGPGPDSVDCPSRDAMTTESRVTAVSAGLARPGFKSSVWAGVTVPSRLPWRPPSSHRPRGPVAASH